MTNNLLSVPPEARPTLESLRRAIQAAAPQAVEKISYRMPMYMSNGYLVAFNAQKNHVSFVTMSEAVVENNSRGSRPQEQPFMFLSTIRYLSHS